MIAILFISSSPHDNIMHFDPISPEIRQTILEAKENGMTRMQICLQFGLDWETVLHCLSQSTDKIIEKDMYHQGFRYTFKWVKNRHLVSQQDRDSPILHRYLSEITKNHYPLELFNNINIQRISQFRLNRLKRGIVAEIAKKLIVEKHINETISIHELTKIAKHTIAEHVNAQKPKPSHVAVQTRILEVDPYSIAMEVPIWGTPPLTAAPVTGHIDIIRIVDDAVQIVDYKPENNFMPSVPQVAFYGILLQKSLNLKKVTCVSFSSKKFWEYKPDILYFLNDILVEHNIKFFSWQQFLK